MFQKFTVLALIAAMLLVLKAAPLIAAVDDKDFTKAFDDLDSNKFAGRQAASLQIRSWILSNSLTAAQLGQIRDAVTNGSAEVKQRAAAIMTFYESVQNLGNDIRTNTEVMANPKDAPGPPGAVNYQLDSIFANTDLKSKTFTDLSKLSEAARNSLKDGVDQNLLTRLQALRDRVAGLTKAELDGLNLDKTIQSDLVDKLDASIKAVPALLDAVKTRTSGSLPPAPGTTAVAAAGPVDVGSTFGLSVTQPAAPGSVEVFNSSDYTLALADPNTGWRFVGSFFDVLGSDNLDMTGSTVGVSIVFGPGSSLGNSIDHSLPVCLARLANGDTDILSCTSDPSADVLSGSYAPESLSSGLDQFGEFALIQQAPEPGTSVLLLAGIALVAFVKRCRLAV